MNAPSAKSFTILTLSVRPLVSSSVAALYGRSPALLAAPSTTAFALPYAFLANGHAKGRGHRAPMVTTFLCLRSSSL